MNTLQLVNPHILAFIVGLFSHPIIGSFMLTGQAGVDYYAEAHLSKWNAVIHSLGMPVTMLGMVMWIPALLHLNVVRAQSLMYALYFFYIGHYFWISTVVASTYALFYLPSLAIGLEFYAELHDRWTHYKNTRFLRIAGVGLLTSATALTFQEIVGHYLGGDIASRPEAVANAVLYAQYFAVSHWFF